MKVALYGEDETHDLDFSVGTTYTVSFNVDGAIKEIAVNAGEAVIEPTDPTKTGYTFDGWYLNGVSFDFDTLITGDIELIAAWTLIPVVLESIEVTPPTKLQYLVGDKLDLKGMTVTAKYSDGTTKAITGYTTNPANSAVLNSDGTITVLVSYTEDGVPVGGSFTVMVNKTPGTELTVVSATPTASVKKLNGNKNDLTITVTEIMSDGSKNVITKTFSINNNAAGTYQVGDYKVYVDTKGNTQIRECYIVK